MTNIHYSLEVLQVGPRKGNVGGRGGWRRVWRERGKEKGRRGREREERLGNDREQEGVRSVRCGVREWERKSPIHVQNPSHTNLNINRKNYEPWLKN